MHKCFQVVEVVCRLIFVIASAILVCEFLICDVLSRKHLLRMAIADGSLEHDLNSASLNLTAYHCAVNQEVSAIAVFVLWLEITLLSYGVVADGLPERFLF